MNFSISKSNIYFKSLYDLPHGKLFISTINAHSYNITLTDILFAEALNKSDVLLPDGISIVFAKRFLTGEKLKKIAGADLFYYEMKRINDKGGKCFFLGSSEKNLQLIYDRAKIEFPNVDVNFYSPPYKEVFTKQENTKIISLINNHHPDVLFIGMTAPKQEKWAFQHLKGLEVGHICCIGAVFDFYAGTINRAPKWMIKIGLEWFYRLIKEPSRLWRRYLNGNSKFIFSILKEKFFNLIN